VPRLLLVRHGQTEWNSLGRFQGQADIPLDAVGIAQAVDIGPPIAEAKPAAVWSSDSMRARVTAEAIGLPVVTDPRLREIDLGTAEGLTAEAWAALDPQAYEMWVAGYDVRRGGGETYAEVGVRATAAVRDALASVDDPGALLVVVSHGGTIRAILTRLLELPASPWAHLSTLHNCCGALVSLEDDGRGWRLVGYGVRADVLVAAPSG
jgi:broad specificity phosphatase PhoE